MFCLADEKPNIVIILTDDQGYADVSYNPHSPPEVSTPNIDALAYSSIICTQGYTSGHVCSPTRAGLMTGRYQQRFGVYTAGREVLVSLLMKFLSLNDSSQQVMSPVHWVSGT